MCFKMKMKKVFLLTVVILISSIYEIAFAVPNPASTFCIEQGYNLETRTRASDGGQYSVCTLQNGEECEEWAFYRGECGTKYRKDLPCKKAGEGVSVSECCEGLKPLDNMIVQDNQCVVIVGGWTTCSDCGNNICENWENMCNCPEDCNIPDASGGPVKYGQCGDDVCDNGENTPSYPYYCPEDCENIITTTTIKLKQQTSAILSRVWDFILNIFSFSKK